MQINRLFEIIYILLNKKSTTARELSEHFEVSIRTILRDIETLTTAGIPIFTSQGKGGGISIMDTFVLNKSVISEEEQNQILFALKSMAAVKNINANHTISKFQSLFNKSNTDWIEIDFTNWGSPSSEKQLFSELKQAVLTKQVVEFDYLNSYGSRAHRIVEPLRIVFKAHSWYLQGYCKAKLDYRIYKLSRMRELKLCNESFQRALPNGIGFDTERSEAIQTITIELKFSTQVFYRVYDEFDESRIEANDDGTLTAFADYPYDEWVVGHILSFGNSVEVIQPLSVREEIAKRATLISQKYNL